MTTSDVMAQVDNARTTPGAPRRDEEDGESYSTPSAACFCGRPLPPRRATGAPRVTCSTACLRRRELLERRLMRREVRIADWRAVQGETYSATRVRAEVEALRRECAAIYRQLYPFSESATMEGHHE